MVWRVYTAAILIIPGFALIEKFEARDKMVNTADFKLSRDLLANYPAGYNVLPVSSPHDVLSVSLQLALYHIVDMNERAQTLTTNCEIITKWHDVFLEWNPQDYENITDTHLPWDKVWTPDIVLYNSAGDGEQGREMRTLIQVAYDGNVTLLTQAIYMSKCTIDVSFYPFDAQQCELKFASWSTEVTRLNMTIGKIDRKKILSLYSPSGVFELKRFFAKRHEMPDPCCDGNFADVTYYLMILRRPKFFLFNYIQPAVLINILALFVFLIPAESGEKITLGISTMLNMTVFLMTIMNGLPATDQTPIISIYYAVTMVLTTAATVLGVIVLRIHHQGRRGIPVPPKLRTMARWMAVLSFSTYPPIEKQLENLNNGNYKSVPHDDYCYNIKDYDYIYKKKKPSFFSTSPAKTISRERKSVPLKTETAPGPVNKVIRNGKPVFSPKGGARLRKAKLFSSRDNLSKGEAIQESIKTTSVVFVSEDVMGGLGEQATSPTHEKTKILWKKAAHQSQPENKSSTAPELSSAWKELANKMVEERWKSEERKEIIGEEWRKISRIFDRFLLILFVVMSLINTLWCIFTSPHFPNTSIMDDEDIPVE